MGRQGFYFDQTRCVGCNACQMACKDYHDLEQGMVFRRVSTWEMEPEKDSTAQILCLHYSGACNHCADAPCLEHCPVHAISRREDGTVIQDPSLCIGCGTCTWVCPYGAPALSRNSGTALKCDGCAERRAKGLEPVCVEACITHCLQYGDLEELSKGHGTIRELPFLPGKKISDPSLAIRPRYAAGDERDLPSCKEVSAPSKQPEPIALPGKKALILGGGIAGVKAAETMRMLSPDLEITILSAEEELPYSRPLLSKTYIKSLDVTKILLHPSSWYEEQKIQMICGAVINRLDPQTRTVTLEDGRTFGYDVCIYALGAHAWVPPMEGLPMKGVYTVRTAEDMDRIHSAMAVTSEAVVLGGGVIGLEIAEELHRMGLHVTILEAAERLMGRLLDEESAAVLKAHLEAVGIHVEEGVSAEKAVAEELTGRLKEVVLKDGRHISAGVMVVSCGIRANTALAEAAGLACERGVTVDNHMETSIPGIYAAGDCIRLNGRNPGLWKFSMDTAEKAATAAVYALAGKTLEEEICRFESEVMMSTGGISIYASGTLEGEGTEVSHETPFPSENTEKMQEFAALPRSASTFLVNHRLGENFRYQKYCYKDNKLVGAVLMGDLSDLREVKKQLKKGAEQL